MSGDVFEEDDPWLALGDDASDVGPEVPGVILASLLAGDGERLARVTRSKAIHNATPRAAVEGLEIRPNRRRVQASFFHARSQDVGGIGFDLHSTDEASSRHRHSNAEVESPGSGAERQDVEGTKSHIHSLTCPWP
jgi:hypothetical protein